MKIQHLEELNRLRKLTGTEFTVHGSLTEPTGVTKQGWNETHREQAERQMWTSLERAHKVDPTGNVVVTFHSSNGLPDPLTRVFDEKDKEEKLKEIWITDTVTGQFSNVVNKPNFFTSEEAAITTEDIKERLEKQNEDAWANKLQHINFNAHTGASQVNHILTEPFRFKEEGISKEQVKEFAEKAESFLAERPYEKLYAEYTQGKDDELKKMDNPKIRDFLKQQLSQIEHGDIYLRSAYQELQNLYNDAYETALKSNDKEDLNKLNKFRNEIKPKLDEIRNPLNMGDFAETVEEGVHVLRTISTPQTLQPLREFALDKASDTFSNLALKSYKEFKDNSPIISIENPPAGSGLSRADDIRDLVERSREEFVKKATLSKNDGGLGLSKSQAEKQAEKLLGVTWDVGHINMIRKYGYGEKELEKETEKIAKLVKHVHLSDNFGMEHTELPMGMGNVPTKKHMEIIDKYNKQVKKIVETGNWYQHFKTTPFAETLEAFGSPVYGMKMSPYWNQAAGTSGGYFSGYGMNPEIHHSIYGTGFANLPVELGGQMAGRSRVSGAPIE